MSGHFRPLTKAICGCLGIYMTVVQQVGIDLDPAVLTHVEDFLLDVLETLPAPEVFPSSLPDVLNTAPSFVQLPLNHWAVHLVVWLFIIALFILFGFIVDRSPAEADEESITRWDTPSKTKTEKKVLSYTTLKHGSRSANRDRNWAAGFVFKGLRNQRRRAPAIDQGGSTFLEVGEVETVAGTNTAPVIECSLAVPSQGDRRRRSRAIDRENSRTIVGVEVETVTGTNTVQVIECSLAVPIYRNNHVNVGVVFCGTDAELMLFALFLKAMITCFMENVANSNGQLAAACDQIVHLNHMLEDAKTRSDRQGNELTQSRAHQKQSKQALDAEEARNVQLQIEIAAQEQHISNQDGEITDLRTTGQQASTQISALTDANNTLQACNDAKDTELSQLRAQLAERHQSSKPEDVPTPKPDTDDPKTRTVRRPPPSPFSGIINQKVVGLETTNAKQATRIIELEDQVKALWSTCTCSTGHDNEDISLASSVNGMNEPSDSPSATNEDGQIEVHIGKAAIKLPPTAAGSSHGSLPVGGAAESVTNRERPTPQGESTQDENQDDNDPDDNENESQAALDTPGTKKKSRRGKRGRKGKGYKQGRAAAEGTVASENGSISEGQQLTQET
ncbi:MAG: hypothetical protein L6R40_002607 [Gallowayella cf. fulva]|nr:MAG: hypothetical protein L6R40_002607 [Xanthomendoza cf. fulva]